VIEIGRRRFITGIAALVAAPAVIRIAPLMPISTRHTPLYVPVNWLADLSEDSLVYSQVEVGRLAQVRALKMHAWPRPMAENWVNLLDFDLGFARNWARRLEEENNGLFDEYYRT